MKKKIVMGLFVLATVIGMGFAYPRPCSMCFGSGQQTCTRCYGNVYSKCPKCHGEGEEWTGQFASNGDMVMRRCLRCDGVGEIRCSACNGEGTRTCNYFHGTGSIDG